MRACVRGHGAGALAALATWVCWFCFACAAQVARAQPRIAAPPASVAPAAVPPAAAPPAVPAPAAEALPAALPAAIAPARPRLSLLDAVRSALRRHPSIAVARVDVASAESQVTAAHAPFDTSFGVGLSHDRVRTPGELTGLPGQQITDTTTLGVSAQTGFRWGTQLQPSVSLARVHSRNSPSFMGLPGDPVQQAHAELALIQPLLRGAGTTGAASGIREAEHRRDGQQHLLAHSAQAQALDVIQAYYQLSATEQELVLARGIEARSQKLVEETRALVDADQRPRGDLRQLLGNLANRKRGVIEALAARAQAGHALALAMGLGAEQEADYALAQGLPVAAVPALAPAQLADEALRARRDLQAADEALTAAQVAFAGADHNTLPQLDLSVSVGYTGALRDDGVGPFFAAAGSHVPGIDASAALSLTLPVENSAQQSERQLRHAERQRAEILRDDLRRTVRVRVLSALDDLRLSAEALVAAQEAEREYLQAQADENDKLRAGLSTVIDVVATEEALTQAQLSRIRNQLQCALALARLRFELGALPAIETEADAALSALAGPDSAAGTAGSP